MSCFTEVYLEKRKEVSDNLASGKSTAYAYMREYEDLITTEDYASAKAVAEVLKEKGWNVEDTFPFIAALKLKR